MTDKRDNIFSDPLGEVKDFSFDETVVSVFPDMIERSVPGYSTVVAISALLTARFSQPDTALYDLGCSLGASSFAMARSAAAGCRLCAVDNSPAMMAQFQQRIAGQSLATPIDFLCADICDIEISNASVVTLNYTLQFIAREKRQALLQKIQRGMVDGGVLILSEKLAFDEPAVDELFVDLHHEFKRANGYSDLEISQKRDAIEAVLLPESLATHQQRLRDCGFRRVAVWFQCFNFASLVAIK